MTQGYGDPSQGPGVAYRDYTVYDQHYKKVGRVDDLFVDDRDEPEYIGVKMGLLGTKSTLIPMELVRVNDRRKLVEVAANEETITHAPTFDDDGDITPDFEHRVHGYFGLERPVSMQDSSHYGGYYDSPPDPSREEDLRRQVDTEFGERAHTPHHPATPTPATDLDVPVGEASPTTEPPREDAGGPFDADAATRTEGETRDDLEVQGGREVRVFKRARR